MGTKTINAKNSHKEFSLSKYVSHKYLIDFCYIIKYKYKTFLPCGCFQHRIVSVPHDQSSHLLRRMVKEKNSS